MLFAHTKRLREKQKEDRRQRKREIRERQQGGESGSERDSEGSRSRGTNSEASGPGSRAEWSVRDSHPLESGSRGGEGPRGFRAWMSRRRRDISPGTVRSGDRDSVRSGGSDDGRGDGRAKGVRRLWRRSRRPPTGREHNGSVAGDRDGEVVTEV